MAASSVLGAIKKNLENHLGERIRLRANKGRKKVVERVGVLEQTYPSIFIVKFDEANSSERRVSFSYADLLTESVELVVFNDEGESKFNTQIR